MKLAMLLNRLSERRGEARVRLRQVMKDMLGGRTDEVRIHNQWSGISCVPYIDDWVIVFLAERVWDESGQERLRIHLLALEREPERHS